VLGKLILLSNSRTIFYRLLYLLIFSPHTAFGHISFPPPPPTICMITSIP
jgi:hypothetical protein